MSTCAVSVTEVMTPPASKVTTDVLTGALPARFAAASRTRAVTENSISSFSSNTPSGVLISVPAGRMMESRMPSPSRSSMDAAPGSKPWMLLPTRTTAAVMNSNTPSVPAASVAIGR